MKQFITRENEETLKEIRKTLLEDGGVVVINDYESFYGCGFDRWLRDGLKDINCNIKGMCLVSWLSFPSDYEITLNK